MTLRIAELFENIQARRFYKDQIVHVERIPSQRAWYGDLARSLPRRLAQAVARTGVKRYYVHQAEGINAIRRGKHVIVATSTASA